jgi:hypothetical protein
MTYMMPPILKLAERLMLDVETAVKGFSRYHRYTVGTRMRDQVHGIACAAHKAWRKRDSRPELIGELSEQIDDVKITLQLGSQLRAFASLEQFRAIAAVASELGRQVGGWNKHRKGQNAQAPTAPRQCAKTLSTRDASNGANA